MLCYGIHTLNGMQDAAYTQRHSRSDEKQLIVSHLSYVVQYIFSPDRLLAFNHSSVSKVRLPSSVGMGPDRNDLDVGYAKCYAQL